MGIDVTRDEFAPEDFQCFSARLNQCLDALRVLLERRGFGQGAMSFGAELEIFLVDARGRPAMSNDQVLASVDERCFTVELDRFNIECNTAPSLLSEQPFASLAAEFEQRLAQLENAASEHGIRLALVGILPTLQRGHFGAGTMTNLPRYRALARLLRERRQSPFELNIDGADPLRLTHDNVTFEGATTSLQLHLRVVPERFTNVYNAAQLVTAPALAASGNSPLLLGHRLWEETRVALFKQAVDERQQHERGVQAGERRPPRVCFGQGWLKRGALELFEENVQHYDPLLPITTQEDPMEMLLAGGVPELSELRLHSGTVWRWNRAVYDSADGGHIRIEMRALPAGPSVVDMVANAAFMVGATLALADDGLELAQLPFELAEDNFYRSAQRGLDATLHWPTQQGVVEMEARDIALLLIEPAAGALRAAGVPQRDVDPWLAVFEARVRSGNTGARWLRGAFEQRVRRMPCEQALEETLQRYIELGRSGEPVHGWPP